MPRTLVTGGIRSGKSAYALARAIAAGKTRCFIATAEPFDDDMRARISRHREERARNFSTHEEPLHLARALREAGDVYDVVVVDCLTVWINNLLYRLQEPSQRAGEVAAFLEALRQCPAPVIVVTNEVGLGPIAENELTRRFVDELGRLNQAVAALADEVILMVSGIPAAVKGGVHAGLAARD